MSEQPDAELQQLRADNARLRHLLAREGAGTELRHQVRNTLAQVRAIVRRSSEFDENTADFAAHLEGRLDAILRVQDTIVSGPAAGIDLHLLLSNELLIYLAHEEKQVILQGPDLQLRPKAAELLGLAFHELATNSVKFGALGEADGRVEIRWQVTDTAGSASAFALTWTETGGPPVNSPPSHSGFGTEVLKRMLGYELEAVAELVFAPDGLQCSIAMPFPPTVGTLRPESLAENDEP